MPQYRVVLPQGMAPRNEVMIVADTFDVESHEGSRRSILYFAREGKTVAAFETWLYWEKLE